ncbi:MAG: LysR family transcriptional regulator [Thermoanaerobacteraceae bacterium]|nr:LysR family transcriptional regulator [Thermoanaerobacteraceae bacterium]
MNLSTLELFCLVAKVEKFSTAANIMHLTQPAVSAQMQNLESYLNVKLFERTGRGIVLTEAGQIVYKHARKILQQFENMERELDELLSNKETKLVIGATSTVGDFAIPCTIWTFKEKYPKANIKLEILNLQEIVDKLLENKIDIAIIEGSVQHPELITKHVAIDKIILITSPDNAWANQDKISFEKLKEIPLMIPAEGSGVRKIFEEKLKELSMDIRDLNIVSELGSTAALKSLVESGKGISICCNLAVQKELRRNTLRAIELEEFNDLDISFQLIYPKDKYLSPLAHRFIRFLCPDDPAFC